MAVDWHQLLLGLLEWVSPITASELQHMVFLLQEIGVPIDCKYEGLWSEELMEELKTFEHSNLIEFADNQRWIRKIKCYSGLVEGWREPIEYLESLSLEELKEAAHCLYKQRSGEQVDNPVLDKLKQLTPDTFPTIRKELTFAGFDWKTGKIIVSSALSSWEGEMIEVGLDHPLLDKPYSPGLLIHSSHRKGSYEYPTLIAEDTEAYYFYVGEDSDTGVYVTLCKLYKDITRYVGRRAHRIPLFLEDHYEE